MIAKPVFGYEEIYQISKNGEITRIVRTKGRKVGRSLKWRKGWGGYPVVSLTKKSKSRVCFVHCLVADAFLGKRPVGLDINHKDSNRWNPAFENLEYVTRSENIKHSYKNGRTPIRGEKRKNSKLNEKMVIEIRNSKESIRSLGKKYNVSAHTILMVKKLKRWKHVQNANN